MREERVIKLAEKPRIGVAVVVSGILGMAFSMVCLLCMAFMVAYSNLSEAYAARLVGWITYGSALLAGLFAGRAAKRRGWLSGILSGGAYLFAVRLIGAIWARSVNRGMFLSILLGAILGAVGGIVGINLSRKRHS